MAEIRLEIHKNQHQIKPAVVNAFQGNNLVDNLVFTMANYTDGDVDFSKMTCYAVCYGVLGIDEIILPTKVNNDGELEITWTLNSYTLSIGQNIYYQIVFKEADATVLTTYKAVILCNESIPADEQIVAQYPTILKQIEENVDIKLENMTEILNSAVTSDAYFLMNYDEPIPLEQRVNGKFYLQRLNDYDMTCVVEDANGSIIIDDSSANKDLANTGMITNCLLEVPQNIKLDMTDDVLTLKAGSKVYVPNGFEDDGITPKFDEHLVFADYICNFNGTNVSGTQFIMYSSNAAWESTIHLDYFSNNCYSSETQPTVTTPHALWYDLSVNKMKTTQDAGVTWVESQVSLPICKVNLENGFVTHIEQIFNGFGYMDSILFSLPNVVGLSSQGRVEYGRYKNRILENGKVSVITIDENWVYNLHCFYSEQSLSIASNYIVSEEKPLENECIWRKPSENKMYRIYGGEIAAANVVYLGEFTHELGKIIEFDIPEVINLAKPEVATPTTFGLMRVAAPVDETDCSCNDASITPANLYGLADYRLMGTAYKVGDTVGCPYHHELQLRCTQAGTTSSEALDTKTTTKGTTITDGTVKWLVENAVETEVAKGLDTKVNVSDMVVPPFVSYNNITNCILEAPHRINVELKDGVLTLKKGSVVIVPNGAGKFDERTITSDISYPSLTHTTCNRVVFLNTQNNVLNGYSDTGCFSGTSQPETTFTAYIWYDTTNNVVKSVNNGSWTTGLSLPICIGNYVNGSGFSSIDQVFNGQGYIGATRWVDKGVKGLIPNGKNDDGSLNNIEYITSKVELTTRILTNRQNYYFVGSSFSNISDKQYYISQTDRKAPTGTYVFNTTDNFIYDSGGNKIKCFYLGSGNTDATRITSFEAQQSFRAVDYNDIYTKNDVYTKSEADTRYVNVTGDTMSGNLTVVKDQGTYNIKSPNLDNTANPTAQNISAFRMLDKNSKILGDIRFVTDTDGSQTTSIFARHARTGSEKNAILSVILDKDGKDRVATNNLSVTNATISNGRLIINNPEASPFQITTNEINKQTVASQITVYDNTLTTAPTAHNYIQRYRGFDKNGKEVGCFETVHDTSNNVRSIIRTSRIISGATKTANLNIGVRVNGKRYTQFDIDEFVINGVIVPYNPEPDYASGYAISDGWTAPKFGWLYVGANADAESTITIAGVLFQVSYDTGDGRSNANMMFPIAKSNVVSNFVNVREARFYPCKGG